MSTTDQDRMGESCKVDSKDSLTQGLSVKIETGVGT